MFSYSNMNKKNTCVSFHNGKTKGKKEEQVEESKVVKPDELKPKVVVQVEGDFELKFALKTEPSGYCGQFAISISEIHELEANIKGSYKIGDLHKIVNLNSTRYVTSDFSDMSKYIKTEKKNGWKDVKDFLEDVILNDAKVAYKEEQERLVRQEVLDMKAFKFNLKLDFEVEVES